jgi:hypothetical protein
MELNQQILANLADLTNCHFEAYRINTSKVAQHRVDVIRNASKQMEKNPNKVGKTEIRLLNEMNRGSSIEELISQAEHELHLIHSRKTPPQT